MQRLKDADEATRRMTRDEYVHYSECRQASFTFRKSKKFREFINASAYLDVKPNDDIIDILGFLAFEVVRELCLGAVAIKRCLEEQMAARIRADAMQAQQPHVSSGSTKRPYQADSSEGPSAQKKPKTDPLEDDSDQTLTHVDTASHVEMSTNDDELCTLFTLPPSVETPLLASHIQEAFARLQRKHPPALSSGIRGSAGPGGLRRTRVFVI